MASNYLNSVRVDDIVFLPGGEIARVVVVTVAGVDTAHKTILVEPSPPLSLPGFIAQLFNRVTGAYRFDGTEINSLIFHKHDDIRR